MTEKPKILGVIPARGGSKGIPNKNIKLLDGKPLIGYTIESALQASRLDTIVVSSDSVPIQEYARQFPRIEVPFLRPKHLSKDYSPSIHVIQHALNYYLKQGYVFDYVALLQPTSPFRSEGLIDNAASHLIQSNCDCLITVRKTPEQFHPYWAFENTVEDGLLLSKSHPRFVTRRQDLPQSYHRDGKIYLTRTTLIERGILLGGKIAGFVTDTEPDINIDTFSDWARAENEIGKWN